MGRRAEGGGQDLVTWSVDRAPFAALARLVLVLPKPLLPPFPRGLWTGPSRLPPILPARGGQHTGCMSRLWWVAAALTAVAVLMTACGGGDRIPSTPAAHSTSTVAGPSPSPSSAARSSARAGRAGTGAEGVPRFEHIIVVVEENKSYGELVGTSSAPFLNDLAGSGAVLTQSYAVTHPSEPNYLALFSGSTQGLTNDSCPHQYNGPNLAASVIAVGETFMGYSESLPSSGYQGCRSGDYARKHNPWVNFPLPVDVNQPMTAFPADFSKLPTVSFVIPNLGNDIHDGSIAQGDQWLASHLGAYKDWAATHNSLLVVTTDEDDKGHGNHITTILTGAHVRGGQYPTRTDHYGLLRTLLDSLEVSPFGAAATSAPVAGIWSP